MFFLALFFTAAFAANTASAVTLTFTPSSVTGETQTTGVLSLPSPVTSSITYSLAADSYVIELPETVTIAAGASSASFNANVSISTLDVAVTVTATAGASTASAVVQVNRCEPFAPAPLVRATDQVWIDEPGAPGVFEDGAVWDTSQAASGTHSHSAGINNGGFPPCPNRPGMPGICPHVAEEFDFESPKTISRNGVLLANIFVSTCRPLPDSIRITFSIDSSTVQRSLVANWGAPLDGDTESDQLQIADIPEAGAWHRFEINIADFPNAPAGDLTAEIYGVMFESTGGGAQVWFDRTGLAGAPGSTDTTAPQITITSPADGAVTRNPNVAVAGTATDNVAVANVTVNGQAAALSGSNWTATAAFTGDGTKTVTAVARDSSDNQQAASVNIVLDTAPPVLAITTPANNATVYNTNSVTIRGTGTDALSGLAGVTCGSTAATVTSGSFVCTVPVAAGANSIVVTATDAAGNVAAQTLNVTEAADTTSPSIDVSISPQPNADDWVSSTATVQFVCSDGQSGIAQCTGVARIGEEGAAQLVTGTATDNAGNAAGASALINLDRTPPVLTVDAAGGDTPVVIRGDQVTVTGNVSDSLSGVKSVLCNGVAASVTNGSFTCTVPLGTSTSVQVHATDKAGNETNAGVYVVADNAAPTVRIDSPAATDVLTGTSVTVSGVAGDDRPGVTLTVNGTAVPVVNFTFTATVTLVEGANTITAIATDAIGNTASHSVTVNRFLVPNVVITSPGDLAVVSAAVIAVSGTVTTPVDSVVVNGVAATVSGTTFTAPNVPLQQGRTVVTAVATTASGRKAAANIFVYRDSIPPRLTVTVPEANSTVYQSPLSVVGSVDDLVVGAVNSQQVNVTVNGAVAGVSNRSFTVPVPLVQGWNTLTVTATDQAGNVTTNNSLRVQYLPLPNLSHLIIASGDGQTAPIGSVLPTPLTVRYLSGSGSPLANQPVEFRVTGDNGSLASGANQGRVLAVNTDGQGQASVVWTLGTRIGAALDRVEVHAANSMNSVAFGATTTPAVPNLVVVDAGNAQFGAVGQRLPRPLIAVVVDRGGNRLPNVAVTFSVAEGGGSFDGQPAATVNTDSDGRAVVTPTLGPEAGNDNNVFVAATSQGPSAEFAASGRMPGDPVATRIVGIVEDNQNAPIEGVSVRVDGTAISAQTDAQGQFVLSGVSVGYVKLFVDGTTAHRPGTWPTLEFSLYTVAGIDNRLEMPIFLLPIDVQRGLYVDDVTGGTLTLPELPGFSLTVKAGSATFPGGGRTGTVSATMVHHDKMPMAPAFGQQPRFILTIQPTGTHFDPPAAVTFPNTEGLAAGEITELYSFDHDLGQFVSIGTGTVSADGSMIRSDPGAGIIKGGWHGAGAPAPQGNAKSVTVTIEPKQKSGGIGQTIDVVAKGSPASGGSYSNWQVDDGSVAHFVSQPSCSGQASCTAQLRLDKEGETNISVKFTANGKSATSAKKKVSVSKIRIAAVSFKESLKVQVDHAGTGATDVTPPHWSQSEAPKPVWYVRSAPSGTDPHKMRLTIALKISPRLDAPMQATIEGTSGSIKFKKDVTIPPTGYADLTSDIFEASEGLPTSTHVYDPFEIQWTLTAAGNEGGTPTDIGTSSSPVYVSLAPLGGTAGTSAYLSVLRLALRQDGISDAAGATQATWNAFAGPANVRNWEGAPLFYYQPDVPTNEVPRDGTAALLNTTIGQCRTFVDLLASALAVNGAASERIVIEPTGFYVYFLVNNWQTIGDPDPIFGTYSMKFAPTAHSGSWEYPKLATYGQLQPLPGVAGQNTPTPGTKLFSDHVVLRIFDGPTPSTALPGYFDPSYGQVWTGEFDFQQRALFGFGDYPVEDKTMFVHRVTSAIQVLFERGN